MKIKNKYIAKIIASFFVVFATLFCGATSFGIANSSISAPQSDKNSQNQLKTYKKDNSLSFLNENKKI